MKIYNSKTQKLETFNPIDQKIVKMYVCGPTIYSNVHIGNTRPLIFFDIVKNHLKNLGYEVQYVSNITDIDDKIIAKAQEKNISEEELVDENLKRYLSVCNQLGVCDFYKQPRVTQYIDSIIDFIQKLIDLDYAYESAGDVYFRVDKIDEYGELSKVDLESQISGARVAIDSKKQYEYDFVLWKKTITGITWNSPFGKGRPGWHTECVVMINEILGSTIDIHGGGVDLKFPHHENENAQSLACGNNLANYWMHNGFINIDNVKMSKSLGNIIDAQNLIDELGSNVVRLLMLQTSYRQPINIDDNFINQTKKINEKFDKVFQMIDIKFTLQKDNVYINEINKFMNNDFAVANVVSYMLEKSKKTLDYDLKNAFLYTFSLLGLVYEIKIPQNDELPDEIMELLTKRSQAKEEKNYQIADIIKADIEKLGYEVVDTRDGVICQKMMKK